jgi:aromatic-amino-acid transaminase
VLGQLKATVRRNYSSPPIHGASIVSRVLGRPGAARQLGSRRRGDARAHPGHAPQPARVLAAKLPGRDFSYFLTQRGMFSYTGLSAAQVDRCARSTASTWCARGACAWPDWSTRNVQAVAEALRRGELMPPAR